MLLTDGNALTVQDLELYEADIQTIATANGINLDNKLAQVLTEINIELQSFLQRASGGVLGWNYLTPGVFADTVSTRIRSEQIIITDALKLWLIYAGLALTFGDAWARKTNDKYEEKVRQYQDRAVRARGWYFDQGVATVAAPLPRPGKPALSDVSGGSQAQRSYDVQITWVDANGKESAPSVRQSFQVAVNKLLKVDITALSPPTGQTLTAGQSGITLGNAKTWHVYAVNSATAGGVLSKQTATATDIATKTWTEPTTGLITGAVVGTGQEPDAYRGVQNALMRG